MADRIEKSEEMVVTKDGSTVVCATGVLLGLDGYAEGPAADRMRVRAWQISGEAFDWDALKVLRDEGRP